jgi:NAD(P)-dependent dehydrogenase (short-subunit alcohol dehydrogenase family)
VVTGGSSGIGRQLARDLAQAGECVLVWDIQPPAPDEQVDYCCVDLLDPASIGVAAASCDGSVRAFVHCAGVSAATGITHANLADQMRRAYEIHTVSFVIAVQALLDQLIAGKGSVVAIASAAMNVIYPGTLAYGASKAALRRCIDQLAVELAPFGIRVNGVAPGAIATPMTAHRWQDPEFAAQRCAAIPLGRQGVPADISSIVRFLASDAAGYVTGETILADGGVRHGIFNFSVQVGARRP